MDDTYSIFGAQGTIMMMTQDPLKMAINYTVRLIQDGTQKNRAIQKASSFYYVDAQEIAKNIPKKIAKNNRGKNPKRHMNYKNRMYSIK